MRVRALYFGGLRARLGAAGAELELPDGSSAQDVARLVCEPLGPEWLGVLRLAVNEELAPAGARLKEGDEIALLPPVSGGLF